MILAIDTATRMIGLALHDGNQVLAESMWLAGRKHTVNLAPELAMMLRRNEIAITDLTAVAVASGPGSYTGLRIGLALAKGLCLAHNMPLAAVPTLDILAAAQPRSKLPMLAVIEVGRKRLAGVWYKWGRGGWKAQSEPENLSWLEIVKGLESKTYLCGEINAERRAELRQHEAVELADPATCVRRPAFLAQVGAENLKKKKRPRPEEISPFYLGMVDGKVD
ncbi:MAG: tRNA (adenosine(37)-N6)-threonylcarbamoyltransferase complex dimerization subunit type 1 TsaB [Anaerolineales bacterium]